MSQPRKRRRFLQSSEIAELFLDSDSGDESDASSVEGGPEGVPGVVIGSFWPTTLTKYLE